MKLTLILFGLLTTLLSVVVALPAFSSLSSHHITAIAPRDESNSFAFHHNPASRPPPTWISKLPLKDEQQQQQPYRHPPPPSRRATRRSLPPPPPPPSQYYVGSPSKRESGGKRETAALRLIRRNGNEEPSTACMLALWGSLGLTAATLPYSKALLAALRAQGGGKVRWAFKPPPGQQKDSFTAAQHQSAVDRAAKKSLLASIPTLSVLGLSLYLCRNFLW